MHGAKPNSIKTKIDELNSLPEGFNYNHATTWQKLEKNLQVQKQRNYRWLLYAAVILLIVGGILLWKMNPRSAIQDSTEEKIVKTKSIVTEPVKTLIIHPGNKGIKSLQIPLEQALKKTDINKNRQKVQTPVVNDTIQLVADFSSEKTAHENLILPSDSVNSNVIVKNAKPKFRIAHINELNRTRAIPLASEEKNSVVFRKPLLSSVKEEPLSNEEKTIARKKSRPIFSPVSSSQ